MPIWDALVKCPDGVYVKRDFRWYEVLSRLMLEVVRELSPRVEYYSIDEFFFVAGAGPGQTFQELAVSIRDRIRERVGVPVTVGIARTRTLAKLISDAAKPIRRPGGARPQRRGGASGRPAGDRDHRDCRPAGGPALCPGESAPASTWRGPTAGWSGRS